MYLSKRVLLIFAAATAFATELSPSTAEFQITAEDVKRWEWSRERLGVVHLFRKGSALPCGDDITLRVDRKQQYGVEEFLEDGRRFRPKNIYEALGSDPKVFPIPYDSGIWQVNAEKVTQAVNSEDLDDVPIVLIRARNGKVRVVYLDDGTTFWLKAEDSFPGGEKESP